MNTNNQKERLILTDCDGVLLRWEFVFEQWMLARGYERSEEGNLNYYLHLQYKNITSDQAQALVHEFNESEAMYSLPPLRDSRHYVELLHKQHGYRFRVITSLSLNPRVQKMRDVNLQEYFGDAIESVVYLDTGEKKDRVLAPYKDTGMFWLEDMPRNSDAGHKLGLKSILVSHSHNFSHVCDYPIVQNWKEIYKLITTKGTV